jgi:hypothetical protein
MPSFGHLTIGRVLEHGESPFRFTIYAGTKQDQWNRMLASNPWRCMELALKAKRLVEARAFLSQARDFYAASEDAGATSRPLLMYYAFLNLAKTLIKTRNANIDLSGAFHGVRESSSNRQAQRFRLTSQSVEVEHPRNNRVHILNEFASVIGWGSLASGHKYGVCDLLSQIPGIHRAYTHIRGQSEHLHPIADAQFRFDQPKRRLWAVLWTKHIGPKGTNALSRLKSRQYFSSFFTQKETDQQHEKLATFETSPVAYAQNPRAGLSELGQLCVKAGVVQILTSAGYRYYFADVQPAARVHQALAAYMAMFYFGSVARYRPSHLEKILFSEFAWAIDEFLSAEGQQFVYFVANRMLEREVVRPMALL